MVDKPDLTKNTRASGGGDDKPAAVRDPFSVAGKEVEASLWRAVSRALLTHKLVGNYIAVERDGKVVTVPAEEIQVPNVLQPQLRERLSKDLHSMGKSLQRVFEVASQEEPLAWAATGQDEVRKVWEWHEPASAHTAVALIDSNGDLQFLFSSAEIGLQGVGLRLRISAPGGEPVHEQEVTLRRLSETDVGALFVVSRYEWPSEGVRVSLDIQDGQLGE